MDRYLVVGQHEWCFNIFNGVLRKYKGYWYYFGGKPEDLSDKIRQINPRYIFFLHWSDYVPKDIVDEYECVCFHPSHLPYGRGGTPVQNLIDRGFAETQLTAFRMGEAIDTGPIYYQMRLALDGTAQAIYERNMRVAAILVKRIIETNIKPVPQEGNVVKFKRRKPFQSEIQKDMPFEYLYDHIRMLSADNYPYAFIEYGKYRIEFINPLVLDGKMLTEAIITENE